MRQIFSWKETKAEDNMLHDDEELDYEIDVEDEDRLLESDQESDKSSSDDDSPSRTTSQSPEANESPSYNDRQKMNYLKCYRTYANSSRSNYRYSEPNTKCSVITDGSYEEDEVDEPNRGLTSIDSGVSDPDVSQFTFYENRVDKDPTKHSIYNNNKKTLDLSNDDIVTSSINPTTIFNEQNITYDEFLKNSRTNVAIHPPKSLQTPNRSKKKSDIFGKITVPIARIFQDQNNTYDNVPKIIQNVVIESSKNAQVTTKQKSINFTRTFCNNAVTTPNTNTDPTEAVPIAGIFHAQNNTYDEDVPKISQVNEAIKSSKNVQTPISELTTIKSPGKANAIVFQPSKKVQEPIISKNKTNLLKQNTSASESDGSPSRVDAMAIPSPKKSEEPINFNRERQSEIGIAKKTSTETPQSPKMLLENLPEPIKPKIIPTNFKVQIKGQGRILVSQPQQLSTLDQLQPSQRITQTKPFTRKRTFEKPAILVNGKDISRFMKSCTAEDARDDTSYLKSCDNIFKVPLKKPPFKPEWQTGSAPVEVPGYKSTENEDTTDLALMVMKSCIASDGDDVVDQSFLDDGASIYEDNSEKLEMVNDWVSKQPGRTIPSVYKGLCYNFFFNNKTCRVRCKNQHSLRVHFAKSSNLTKQEIKVALSFAIDFPSFYEQVLPIFAEFFGRQDDKEGLIYLAHQIFKNNFPINQVDALNTVLINLQQTDLETLKESIEYVLMQVGFHSYTSFGTALVGVIISSEDVPSYWPIMRRMITGGLTLPGKLASEFLTVLVKPPTDSNVCREVYNLILKYKFLALTSVNSEVRDQFLLLAKPKSRTSDDVFQDKSRNNSLSSPYQTAFPPHVSRFNGPSTFYNSPASYKNSTATPEKVLGFNSNDNIHFASLWERDPSTSGAPHFNDDDGVGQAKQYGLDYREPSQRPNRSKININERQSNFYRHSSSDDNSSPSREDLHTIPSGNKFPNRSGFLYNQEGVQYDPTEDYDYAPRSKRKHQQSQSRDAEFDRLFNEDSEPPKKKFQLNPGRLGFGAQNNNMVDESFTGIPAARPRQDLQYAKPPDEPVFGKLCLNPDYTHHVSLHNLYVERMGSVIISEEDNALLSGVLTLGDGHEFLRLLKKYQHSATVSNFVTSALAHLIHCKQAMIKLWNRVLDSMARAMPNFYGSRKIRAIVEVITMNLLFILVTYKLWAEAKDLLMRFTDWDSLVTSRVGVTTIDTKARLSILGKYLFIAKLLQLTEPKFCYKILTCPEFKFMEHDSTWPYYGKEPKKRELRNRNILLTTLLRESYLHHIEVVIDIYKMAFSRNDGIWDFNVIPFINPMLERLMAEKKIPALEYIYKSNVFFEHMDVNILRQFLILMFSHLPASDGFKIFDICTSRSLYKRICINDVLQEDIVLNTNHSNKEMEIIIRYCFHKLVEIRYLPSSGFRFWIKYISNSGEETDEEVDRISNEATMKMKAITTAKNKVMNMLDKFFQIRGRTTTGLDVVEVAKDDLILFLERR